MAGSVQRNTDGALELRGLGLFPPVGGPYDVSPSIGRVIANLAALDGSLTRLLQCTADGELRVSATDVTDALAASLGSNTADGGLWLNTVSAATMLAAIQEDLDAGLPVDLSGIETLLTDIAGSIPGTNAIEDKLDSLLDSLGSLPGDLTDIKVMLSDAYDSETHSFKVESPS